MILPDGSVPGDTPEQALARQKRNAERRVQEQAAAKRLEASSIGEGGLTVKGGEIRIDGGSWRMLDVDGSELGYVGPLFHDGEETQRGLIFSRSDGTRAFVVYGGEGGTQFVAMLDRQGNIIVSDDTFTGQGLANPWLPLGHPYPLRQADPIVWTTPAEATFGALWNIPHLKQHPKIWVKCYVTSDADTTGEVRLWDGFNNVQYGATVPLAAFDAKYVDFGGPFEFPGFYQQESLLQVQARVTGGAGRIGTQVYFAYGRQS